jgi:AcrR family transcriptional regulator
MIRKRKINVKEQIFDKSIQLFLVKGYNATTIRDITAAVGITPGSLYWHFKSKHELLYAIIDHYDATFTDAVIREVTNSQGNFLTKMRYQHKWATEFAYQHRDLCICFLTVAAEMVGSKTDLAKRIQAIYTKYRIFLRELLELGKKEGCIRDNLNLDLTANVINSIHNGSLLEWYINYDEIDGPLFARTYRDVILFGIVDSEAVQK